MAVPMALTLQEQGHDSLPFTRTNPEQICCFAFRTAQLRVTTACSAPLQFCCCSGQGFLIQRLTIRKIPLFLRNNCKKKTPKQPSCSCKSKPTGYWHKFGLPSPSSRQCGEAPRIPIPVFCPRKGLYPALLGVAMVTARCRVATS